MGNLGEKIAGLIAALFSVAVVALLVSQRANTANVAGAFFGGLSQLIATAVSPVTGTSPVGGVAPGLSGGTWSSGPTLLGVGSSNLTAGFASGNAAFGLSVPTQAITGLFNSIGSGLGNLFGGGGGGGSDSLDTFAQPIDDSFAN